jgi:cold shock CspA family protein
MPMPKIKGVVLWYDPSRFGFIRMEDALPGSRDVFVSREEVEKAGLTAHFKEDAIVTFFVEVRNGRRFATNLTFVGLMTCTPLPPGRFDGTVIYTCRDSGFAFVLPDACPKRLYASGKTIVLSPFPYLNCDMRVSCRAIHDRSGRWEAVELGLPSSR